MEGIHLNGGDPAAAATLGYNAVLRRMLGYLARSVGAPLAEADGWNLIDLRPQEGWVNLSQVRDFALGSSQAKLDALKPYILLSTWVDMRVIAPNATAAMTAATTLKMPSPYRTWADLKLGRNVPGGMASRGAPGFERSPLSGRIVGRAPVSLAWARHRKPVLMALMAGLKGDWLDQATVNWAVAQGFKISDMELNDAQKKVADASGRLAKLRDERNAALSKKKALDDAQEKLLTTEAEVARMEEELARLKGEQVQPPAEKAAPKS